MFNPDTNPIGDMIADALANRLTDALRSEKKVRTPATAEHLRNLGNQYMVEHSFIRGDLVQWKPGLKCTKWPTYGEPAVVLEIAPGQRSDYDKDTSNHSNEPEDIRIGIYHDENKILFGYWMDSSRFEPYIEPAAADAPADTDGGTPMTEQPQPLDAPVSDQVDATE